MPYKTRFYAINKGTSIMLDQVFWEVIDEQAAKDGIHWKQWVDQKLEKKPENVGRACWLRVQIVNILREAA